MTSIFFSSHLFDLILFVALCGDLLHLHEQLIVFLSLLVEFFGEPAFYFVSSVDRFGIFIRNLKLFGSLDDLHLVFSNQLDETLSLLVGNNLVSARVILLTFITFIRNFDFFTNFSS